MPNDELAQHELHVQRKVIEATTMRDVDRYDAEMKYITSVKRVREELGQWLQMPKWMHDAMGWRITTWHEWAE